MIKELARKLTVSLESSAKKSAALEKTDFNTNKVFFGSQALPKELR